MEPCCLHELFEAQATRRPSAPAVIVGDALVTFGDLNSRANQLAHHLRAHGVGPETLVGLHVDRSAHLYVALLAILKAGGAYVPLDPEHPTDRLRWIMEDAALSLVVTRNHLKKQLLQDREEVGIDVDADWPAIAKRPRSNLVSGARPENLCYCAYTSGTTGRPRELP